MKREEKETNTQKVEINKQAPLPGVQPTGLTDDNNPAFQNNYRNLFLL